MASLALGFLIVGMGALIYFRVRKVATNELRHVDAKLDAIQADIRALARVQHEHLADHKGGRAHRRRGE